MLWLGKGRRSRDGLPASLQRHPRFKCFGCCHVSTGTLCLGLYYLLLQLVCAGLLLLTLAVPERVIGSPVAAFDRFALQEQTKGVSVYVDSKPVPEPIRDDRLPQLPEQPLMQQSFRMHNLQHEAYRRVHRGDVHMALIVLSAVMCLTVLLLHGVLTGTPMHLLPFFCYQVFDFVLGCLTAVGHYSWLPHIQAMLEQNPDLQLRGASAQWLAMLVLLLCVLALGMKAYCIGVVWACYQYLIVSRAHLQHSAHAQGAIGASCALADHVEHIDEEELASLLAAFANNQPPSAQLSALPDYDSVAKQPPNYESEQHDAAQPPPAYNPV